MTVQLERLATLEQEDAALPVALMPEVSDQLAQLAEQLRVTPYDRKSIALDEKERYIGELIGDQPGRTLINSIVYLSGVYDDRAVDMTFEDGSSLRTWGTRDKAGIYMTHRYYVQQTADGKLRYRVLTLGDEGRKLYDIDDEGAYKVTSLPSAAGQRIEDYRSHALPEHTAEHAMQALFYDSLVSSREVKDRTEPMRATADSSALLMLANGPLEPALYNAASVEDIDKIFHEYEQPREVPFDVLFIRP